MRNGGSLFLALVAALAALAGLIPLTAGAAVTVTAEEPFEEAAFVPDLGATTATVGDDGTLRVRTRIVARPPAGWGGCVPLPSGLCVPARVTVSWLLDWQPGGNVLEDGADAKVVATPALGTTTWQALRWDAVLARWSAATVPAATTDIGGATWSLAPPQLGIPASATIALRIAARFHVVGDDGVAIDAADDAGPIAIPLGGFSPDSERTPVPTAPGAAPTPAPPATPQSDAATRTAACVAAARRLRTLEARVERLEKVVRGRGTAARRKASRAELRRLRPRHSAARTAKRRACAPASQPRGL